MLIGPRFGTALLAGTVFLCACTITYGTIRSRESDSLSALCFHCAPTPAAILRQSEQSSSDPLVESMERALSEGNAEKANDLLTQILQRPHLSSDFLLRMGIKFAERERYREAAAVFHRCIQEYPETFEAYYNLALSEIAQQKWSEALTALQQAP